jgi:hypothetical protein
MTLILSLISNFLILERLSDHSEASLMPVMQKINHIVTKSSESKECRPVEVHRRFGARYCF